MEIIVSACTAGDFKIEEKSLFDKALNILDF